MIFIMCCILVQVGSEFHFEIGHYTIKVTKRFAFVDVGLQLTMYCYCMSLDWLPVKRLQIKMHIRLCRDLN